MNIVPYIFYPLTLGLLIFTIAFFKYPRYSIAGIIIAKPIIDLTWDYNIFLDINFLKLYAGLFVILGVIYIIVKRVPILTFHGPLLSFPISNASFPRRRESSNCHPEPQDCHPELVSGSTQNSPFHRFSVSPFHFLSFLWLIFLGLNFVSIFFISEAYMPLSKISYFLRILTGFVALIIFAYVFDFKKDKKFVLSIFIIAGIFPILLWLIPVIMGNPIISNDPLRRIMGPYLNFWQFNFIALQTIVFCLAYLALFSRHCEPKRSGGEAISTASQPQNFPPSKLHSIIKSPFHRFSASPFRMMTIIMLIVSVAMVYKCYSKAGWISVVAIFLIWFTLQRKFISASLVVLITAIILFVNPFSSDFQKTFRNEIDYYLHRPMSKQGVFRGRLSRWEKALQYYKSLPVINKTFGVGTHELGIENDYVRILIDNGIIGILTYISILGLTICYLIVSYTRTSDPIVLAGIMAVVILMIMSVGANPTLIPNFQWFVWGPVGFILGARKRLPGEHPFESKFTPLVSKHPMGFTI